MSQYEATTGRHPGAHFECDFALFDPRVQGLSPTAWTFYSKLWILAVHERRDRLCTLRYSGRFLSKMFSLHRHSVLTSLKVCHVSGLIIADNHSIFIPGVCSKHKHLQWKPALECCLKSGTNLSQLPTTLPLPLPIPLPLPLPSGDEPIADDTPAHALWREWEMTLHGEAGLSSGRIPDLASKDKGLKGINAIIESLNWNAKEYFGGDMGKVRAKLVDLMKQHKAGKVKLFSMKATLNSDLMRPNGEAVVLTDVQKRMVAALEGKR